MVKENCGVVGIFSQDGINVIPMLIDSLRALQHRGQEAWGIAVPNKTPLKKLALVSSSASEFKRISDEYSSFAAIGGNSNYNWRTKQLSTEYLQDFYKELLKK